VRKKIRNKKKETKKKKKNKKKSEEMYSSCVAQDARGALVKVSSARKGQLSKREGILKEGRRLSRAGRCRGTIHSVDRSETTLRLIKEWKRRGNLEKKSELRPKKPECLVKREGFAARKKSYFIEATEKKQSARRPQQPFSRVTSASYLARGKKDS